MSAEHPRIRSRLIAALVVWRIGGEGEAPAPELSPDDRRALEALGYLGG